ncbi:MAG: response regulator [Candidatus Omnitrophica bacterium]|nr:response regulator [Candidatus Omnitrophota bacterium]
MDKKILIIDDNEQDRIIMKRFLNRSGYGNIMEAGSGEEGLERTKTERPDLVITDTMMPGIDGFEVCRKLREAYGAETPKIIILTGQVDAVDAVRARKEGADDYCVKTSDAHPLLEAVKKLF